MGSGVLGLGAGVERLLMDWGILGVLGGWEYISSCIDGIGI